MKKIPIDTIYEFSKEQPIEEIAPIYNEIITILNSSISKVCSQRSVLLPIEKVSIEAINNFIYGTNNQFSELDILVTIESPQLEINSEKLILNKWEVFKKKLSYAWNNRKRKSKRKLRKELKLQENNKFKQTIPYNINSFKYDIFNEICNYFSTSTLIHNKSNKIKVTSQIELGINFNIYVGLNSKNKIKLYDPNQNGFWEASFKDFEKVIAEKFKSYGENFGKIFRIFNGVYFTINRQFPPNFLIETILLSLNESFFIGQNIETLFINIINYINIDLDFIRQNQKLYNLLPMQKKTELISQINKLRKQIKNVL